MKKIIIYSIIVISGSTIFTGCCMGTEGPRRFSNGYYYNINNCGCARSSYRADGSINCWNSDGKYTGIRRPMSPGQGLAIQNSNAAYASQQVNNIQTNNQLRNINYQMQQYNNSTYYRH